MTWQECFTHAAEAVGYTMFSVAGDSPVVPFTAALARVSSLTQLGHDGAWSEIARHVTKLAPMGVSLVGFEQLDAFHSKEPGFHVILARTPPRIDLAVEQSFERTFSLWLRALAPMLPALHLSAQAQTAAKSLVQAAGLDDPLLAAGLNMLLQFGNMTGKLKALVVLAATGVDDDLVRRWRATDLVDESIFGSWIIEWLWDVDTNAVYQSGRSPLERSDRTLFGNANGLRDVFQSQPDCAK
jgi:hypothetical protein